MLAAKESKTGKQEQDSQDYEKELAGDLCRIDNVIKPFFAVLFHLVLHPENMIKVDRVNYFSQGRGIPPGLREISCCGNRLDRLRPGFFYFAARQINYL